MATVQIIMRGIALIADGDPGWEVYMPFHDCHRVKFRVAGAAGTGTNLNHPGQRLDVSVTGMAPSISAGTNFDQFFDINGPDAHVDGVVLKEGWDRKTTLVTISSGRYSAQLSEDEYRIKREGDASQPKTIGRIGTVGTVEIEGEEIVVTASGRENFTLKFNEDTTLIIDNDCEGRGSRLSAASEKSDSSSLDIDGSQNNRDFKLIYQTVSDAVEPSRQFDVRTGDDSSELPCNQHKVSKLLRG